MNLVVGNEGSEEQKKPMVMAKPSFERIPRSSLFAKLDTFMPMMEQEPSKEVISAVDMVNCDEVPPEDRDHPVDEKEFGVKMDLYLGVLEAKEELNEENIVIPSKSSK
ncbi:hypothetical protein J8273_3722 [Carpediemonas membranifera]|uniref:Uncharacterized protein n=1 Tax=Carpediemonas membranifera TaxID=201153 RepID=A0A8J6BYQ1_9EUKA|nr:hypothetical protein J8273_3722 [Carpediemonas membranifera]|eukprot:KAG9394746.1 hypothetical protein J8273_3722 [Carpediemonas membranifera]